MERAPDSQSKPSSPARFPKLASHLSNQRSSLSPPTALSFPLRTRITNRAPLAPPPPVSSRSPGSPKRKHQMARRSGSADRSFPTIRRPPAPSSRSASDIARPTPALRLASPRPPPLSAFVQNYEL